MPMAAPPSLVETDQELLHRLHTNPRQTPSMLLKNTSSTDSKQYIQNRLKHLRDIGFVTRADRGIYELTDRGERAADNIQLYKTDQQRFWNRVGV